MIQKEVVSFQSQLIENRVNEWSLVVIRYSSFVV
jgi:hypothetical protein